MRTKRPGATRGRKGESMSLLQAILSPVARFVKSTDRRFWKLVEYLATAMLTRSSRRLIAQRQKRKAHSEAWKKGNVVHLAPPLRQRDLGLRREV